MDIFLETVKDYFQAPATGQSFTLRGMPRLPIKAGRLVVDPKKRRRYSLDELLAQCKPSARRSREDRAWQTGPAVGRELI